MKWLFVCGAVLGVLVIAAGYEALASFPEHFVGEAAERAREERSQLFWSRWTFPVSLPLVLITLSLAAALALKPASLTVRVAAVIALATVLAPLAFIEQALTGPGWLRVPSWYWAWNIVFGALCSMWFLARVFAGAR